MSIIYENEIGFYISHELYINKVCENVCTSCGNTYMLNSNLFNINTPYKNSSKLQKRIKLKEERKEFEDLVIEQEDVKQKYVSFLPHIKEYLKESSGDNKMALETADYINKTFENFRVVDVRGKNSGSAVIKEINSSKYLFPVNTEFYCKDICEINIYLKDRKFDVILLDPPWWNKYIRRKRKKSTDSYKMIYNDDLKQLPIENLLSDDGLLVVWCTNSKQNSNALLTDLFPHWNVEFVSKWYWLKITKTGEPICNFSHPPGKQPYEKIIFAKRKTNKTNFPVDGKILVSIPSVLHSHKPPLMEILEKYLSKDSERLEIFARYLLPGWTSYGNEVLKLQNECLFKCNCME
ncbi:N(6)-adenine-specific methyltransferase METTL4 [Diorhabda carinulata]|uniref:N(6)-adenine-specific methyltransferase METTL4 n=1 Tax=Diorhabda carinulata TaxID=1163345 RepID=UPI0025A0C022|nr:N(6)-adenine-specific methyltransferase METTL4 [Diorhabda carinulata]